MTDEAYRMVRRLEEQAERLREAADLMRDLADYVRSTDVKLYMAKGRHER